MTGLILLIVLLAFLSVGIRGYLNGVLAPPFDPEKMTLNYERIGTGSKKMILLHGLTGSLNYWKKGLGKLTDTHSLLLIDLLGFGDSPKPNSKYDQDQHLSAIVKVIKKEGFNTGNAIVVGHSLGAILTLGLAAKHPDWCAGLALIGLPVYKGKKAIKKRYGKISMWDSLSVDSKYKFICFFHPLYITELFRPKHIPKDVFRDVGKHTWVSYYNTLDNVILNTDLFQLASKIKNKKVLFIHGENDTAAPIEHIEALVPLFNHAKFVRIPDAGHQIYLADPDRVWSLIINCFSKEPSIKEKGSTQSQKSN